ncbi:MAG TPA: type II toxin-antitoxin system VapC family toxin [Burkholderiales bacterium]|nr:type II toxin-antitoxin system VapC family toxin [Burkholderiales bacterium]
MARKPKALVFDSWAVLAYLGDEASSQEVADLIAGAHENRIPMYMSTINAGEVWYILAREISESDADKAVADLVRLGIELIDANWSLTRIAGGFKARHRMSYADCFAAALAKERKADLLTGDKEFKQIEGDVSIHWL